MKNSKKNSFRFGSRVIRLVCHCIFHLQKMMQKEVIKSENYLVKL